MLKKNQVERKGKPKTRISRNRSKSNMFMCCGNHLVGANTHSTGEGRFAGTSSKVVEEEENPVCK